MLIVEGDPAPTPFAQLSQPITLGRAELQTTNLVGWRLDCSLQSSYSRPRIQPADQACSDMLDIRSCSSSCGVVRSQIISLNFSLMPLPAFPIAVGREGPVLAGRGYLDSGALNVRAKALELNSSMLDPKSWSQDSSSSNSRESPK